MKLNVWCKPSHTESNGACFEFKAIGVDLLLRDSKDPAGPVLRFTCEEWCAFVDGTRSGEFNIDS